MPSGAAVIRYDGARGVVWRIKYVDAGGRQVKETLGRADAGWTKRKAEASLRARLTDVERDGYRKPEALTFAGFAERFMGEHVPGRNLKRSTLVDYRLTIDRHLVPDVELGDLSRRPELVERYVTGRLAVGLAPKTVCNHLALLGRMFRVAIRWRLVTANPVEMVDPPRGDGPEPEVMSEVEIARLLAAYRQLEADAADGEREWWAIARRVVTVALGTGLRRGELLGLRWSDLSLLDRRLAVRQAWVRSEMTTPKSRTSRRVVHLVEGGHVLAALEEPWQASRFRGDNCPVFGHPLLGTPLDPSKLSRSYMKPALAAAKITKPFRVWHGSGTRHSPTRRRSTRPPTCRCGRATRTGRSPSGTSTRRRSGSRERLSAARPGSSLRSADRYQVPVPTASPLLCPPARKQGSAGDS